MSSHKEWDMDTRLNALAAIARREAPPVVNVTTDVLRRLRQSPAVVAPERPMLWLAAGALAVAALVIVFSLPDFNLALGPLTAFLEEASSTVI